ncbi:MAG: hypothetical protein IT317_24740 [Anaerolineales bacterium]|nr:hypothetical protein [Anaerolineales bacterium]
MRIEGQSKMGYYPTPETSLHYITTWLSLAGDGSRRYLDPCAGKGEALAAIAAAHGPADCYGIELSDLRAAEAKTILNHVLNTGYEYAVLTDETFSLVLLNPPYDGESETGSGTRLEETFLVNTTSRIVPGGVLIYIIPQGRLVNEKIARHLLGWYGELRCFMLAEDDYPVFKQIIILGTRRTDYHAPSGEAMREVMEAWATGQLVSEWVDVTEDVNGMRQKTRRSVTVPMLHLRPGNGEYAIPITPLKGRHAASFRFQYQVVSDEDLLREADEAAARLDTGREWAELAPAIAPPVIEPAMTPKKGHIAMQVSGGLLGTNLVSDSNGRALLIKGNVRKYSVRRTGELEEFDFSKDEDDEKKRQLRKVELEERFQNQLSTLDATGTLSTDTDPATIGELLNQYVAQLAEIVQARNVPQYDMKAEPWEWTVFDSLSKGRILPGRSETGLTDFQKHLAIALGRLCLRHGAGFGMAEMGAGKTTIGIAIAEYLRVAHVQQGKRDAYPALIVGPGIVTGKENWPKEIPEVVPGATSRVVTLGARPLAKPARIAAWLSTCGVALEEKEFEGLGAKRCLDAIQRAATAQRCELVGHAIMALHHALKRAEHHPPARRKGARAPNLVDARIGGYAWLGLEVPRDEANARELAGEYTLAQFIAEHRSKALPHQSFAVLSFETAKLGPGRVPAMTTRWVTLRRQDEESDTDWDETVQVCACATCGALVADRYDPESGAPLNLIMPAQAEPWIAQKRRFCQAPRTYYNKSTGRYEPGTWVWDAEKGKHIVRQRDEQEAAYVCGAPLFENTGLRRESAARYARQKARGVFGLLLVDEVHKSKAKGTGLGWALTVLSQVARYTVGLTGTLFGGNSTSIFWLLYRLAGEVRQEFGFNDERRWAERFGLLKTTFYISPDAEVQDDGAYTGTHFFETVSEKPGISPTIVGLGLKYCTFSSLKDVGLPLPPYSEEIVRLPLTSAMEAQLAEADGSGSPPQGLFLWALEEQKTETGKGAISVWLNTAFNRPDAMFRPETVTFNRRLEGRGRFAVRQRDTILELDAVVGAGELLPKESWLIRTCQRERAQGRKVLVYIRQTGERDIQPRFTEVLSGHGLRVGTLRPSLEPAKRATWLKKHAEQFDVLLTNARLVEVGLNLTMFSTAIFAEMEWSLYVVWQSMRRLYRPGAPRPVKLYFPVYENTLEESALDLIGAKMLAAQTFYGDEISGALVDDGDEGDLLNDLVRKALGSLQVGRAEGLFSLGNDQLVTQSPMGSPTAISPGLVTLADLMARRQEIVRNGRSKPRATLAPPDEQMSLF